MKKIFILFFFSLSQILISGCGNSSNTEGYKNNDFLFPGREDTGIINNDFFGSSGYQDISKISDISYEKNTQTGKINSDIISDNILISNNKLIYSGVFDILLPDSLDEWDYTNGYPEMISLYNEDDPSIYFSLNIDYPSPEKERYNDDDKCKDEYIGTILSTIKKTDGNLTKFINIISYPESTEDTKELCFVYRELVYKISISNKYGDEYINQIFDSLNINKLSTKNNAEISNISESFYNTSISKIYNGIIFSGYNLIYSGFFTIKIPKTFNFRKSIYPGFYNCVDLYLTKSNFDGFEMDELEYINFEKELKEYVEGNNEKEKCLKIRNGGKIFKSDYTTGLYITYSSSNSFNHKRKEGNICFSDDTHIYSISIRRQSIKDVFDIIDSFKFIK